MAVQQSPSQARCLRIERCELRVSDWQWPFAEIERAEIARAWQRKRAELPRLFDGAVYLLREHAIDAAVLTGTLFRTDFKALLHWRAVSAAPADSVREAFGTSLIRSAEGHVLLGRQGPGQVMSGRIYPPSGVIDGDDVRDGKVDIDASIARELAEETGLAVEDLVRVPGYTVALVGILVAIAVEWRSALPAAQLRGRILGFLHSQPEPELDDIVIVRDVAELERESIPPYARVLAQAAFSR